MQYQSQFREPEPSPAHGARAHSVEGGLRDPFGRTLDVARDQDRARYTVRRRNFVRRLARSTTLYDRLYHGVIAVGLGGAVGGVVLGILGLILWGWPVPTEPFIFGYALLLGVFVCLLERSARSATMLAINWIRRLAQAEGIDLDAPVEPWPVPVRNRSRLFRTRKRLRQ